MRQLIRSAGAKLFFLPKYSPDLNPIEQVFAKLKHLLRKAAARTVEAVCAAIGQVLHAFTPEECANYLKNSGYANLISSRFSGREGGSTSWEPDLPGILKIARIILKKLQNQRIWYALM